MFQEKLLYYFNGKLISIAYNYGLALGANDEDGVHDLRVALKRLKAFFNLIEALNNNFTAKKEFKKFRRIAKRTAMIRDSQVQQKLVMEAEKNTGRSVDDYREFLREQEKKGIEIFLQFAKKNTLYALQRTEKDIRKSTANISHISATTKAEGTFYNLRNNMLLLSSEEDLRQEVLHKVRILSKETHYTFEIVNTCFDLFIDEFDMFTKAIKKVHQALGKWHDYDVALEFYEAYLKQNGSEKTDEPHRKLADYFRTERDSFNGTFRTVFDEFKETAISF